MGYQEFFNSTKEPPPPLWTLHASKNLVTLSLLCYIEKDTVYNCPFFHVLYKRQGNIPLRGVK